MFIFLVSIKQKVVIHDRFKSVNIIEMHVVCISEREQVSERASKRAVACTRIQNVLAV